MEPEHFNSFQCNREHLEIERIEKVLEETESRSFGIRAIIRHTESILLILPISDNGDSFYPVN